MTYPKKMAMIGLLFCFMLAGLSILSDAKASNPAAPGPTIVILVRHAEKTPTAADDPPLSEAGVGRALELAHTLEGAGLKGIFTSQYRRTRETAEPLAKLLKLPITQIDATNAGAFASQIKEKHDGDTILVVGHSNTVPKIMEELGVPNAPAMKDSDYDNMYVVHLNGAGEAHLLTLQYGQATE